MPAWRSDPFTEEAVIIAEGRLSRPVDYTPPPQPPLSTSCPFCEGNEGSTPPEVAARRAPGGRPNECGWSVRVIPNKFPTFEAGPVPWESWPAPLDPFRSPVAVGIHEVVIQSPTHSPGFPFLPAGRAYEVFDVYRERLRELEMVPNVGTVVFAENCGPDSGGSLIHPHAQLLATPQRIPALRRTLDGSKRRAQEWKVPCAMEALLSQERTHAKRVVHEDAFLTVVTPFASDVPYQLRLIPTRHLRSLSEANDDELRSLSMTLVRAERTLLGLFPNLSYNVTSLTPPPGGASSAFHWSMDLKPRLVKADAFELVTHVAVNPVPPETAAEQYRRAWPSVP